MARKPKLNSDIIKIMQKIVNTDQCYILMSDSDLVDELNYELTEAGLKDSCISLRTFERYKAKYINGEKVDEANEIADEFCRLYKKSLRQVKNELLSKIKKGDNLNGCGWIMERRFNEWNIRRKHEIQDNSKIVVGFNFTEATPST